MKNLKFLILFLLVASVASGTAYYFYSHSDQKDESASSDSQTHNSSQTAIDSVSKAETVNTLTPSPTTSPTQSQATATPTPSSIKTPTPTSRPATPTPTPIKQNNTNDPAYKVVNKTVSIGTYAPTDIVSFGSVKVSKRITTDLQNLINAAAKEGISLRAVSGYRSYVQQVQVFDSWVQQEMKKNPALSRSEAEKIANTYSARPGHSEHQLGTAVDVLSSESNYSFTTNYNLRYVGWMEKNAQKFNFKISYPKDNPEYVYEPWHLRWYPSL